MTRLLSCLVAQIQFCFVLRLTFSCVPFQQAERQLTLHQRAFFIFLVSKSFSNTSIRTQSNEEQMRNFEEGEGQECVSSVQGLCITCRRQQQPNFNVESTVFIHSHYTRAHPVLQYKSKPMINFRTHDKKNKQRESESQHVATCIQYCMHGG